MTEPEIVPPSDEPDAAVSTGSGGRDARGATAPPGDSASTSGLGTSDEQQRGASGGTSGGDAAYSLSGGANETEPQSPSGT